MRKVLIIGVGAGDPEHVTVQAINAMNAVDVFFVLDKDSAATELTAARQALVSRYVTRAGSRTVVIADPPRDRAAADYAGAVKDWRDERTRLLAAAIERELGPDGVGGILAWGDPALYDGTIRILQDLVPFEVIPGISSVQILTARHRVTLNRVAGAVLITTGRRLAAGWPDGADDVVVMLDASLSCRRYRSEPIDIYWGAYLGTPDEILISGRLDDVIDEIESVRAAARERKGWIMDTYLLRRLES